MNSRISSFLALFTSSVTLICCALPAAIAAIAGGAAVGSLLSAMPWLIALSQHKEQLFAFAAVMVALNAVITLRPKGKIACAINAGKPCEIAGHFQRAVLWISFTLLALNAFLAYGLVPLLRWLNY